jgi:hypothetical protein
MKSCLGAPTAVGKATSRRYGCLALACAFLGEGVSTPESEELFTHSDEIGTDLSQDPGGSSIRDAGQPEE